MTLVKARQTPLLTHTQVTYLKGNSRRTTGAYRRRSERHWNFGVVKEAQGVQDSDVGRVANVVYYAAAVSVDFTAHNFHLNSGQNAQ